MQVVPSNHTCKKNLQACIVIITFFMSGSFPWAFWLIRSIYLVLKSHFWKRQYYWRMPSSGMSVVCLNKAECTLAWYDTMINPRRDIYRSNSLIPTAVIRYTIRYETQYKGSFFDSVVIMNFSSEDVVVAYMYVQHRRQKRGRYWVHPYNVRNIKHSSAVVSWELSQHEDKFPEFYRMSPESVQFLESGFSTVAESGHKLQTRCSTEKLLITIR
jgi:hypothetical protein